ncbi:FmdE family protein [Pseudodesulfovibrio sediminis]|uniref:Formylmethanofuran dehydrogenase subunit E n=1 Tax=Pseudodesulfovibrio sediminis TaxID=2810563 RepID=A0ABM7P946_9BACT|nr:FmdE family protein [Pseudodesulfovibrio sediminis]BCS89924.1 formylmethanofuran dehydrogenase subunit E [Pseudodesulfovibrio sediminis]
MSSTEEFERLLDAAVAFHGHVCGGQIIGVRIGMAGLRELGITDPRGRERKDFIAFVETDRCATDAILTVTGLTPGKRSLKILDYGKMAATFVHLPSGRAVRIHVLKSSMEKASELARKLNPGGGKDAELQALKELSEEDLLAVKEVVVHLEPCDLPGVPVRIATCSSCGEQVLDNRDIVVDGNTYCKPCASGQFYYSPSEGSVQSTCNHVREQCNECA